MNSMAPSIWLSCPSDQRRERDHELVSFARREIHDVLRPLAGLQQSHVFGTRNGLAFSSRLNCWRKLRKASRRS